MLNKIDFNSSTYKLIDNNISQKMPVGYCCYFLHQGYLSTSLLKRHKCLHKGQKGYCNFLKINYDHPYMIKTLFEKEKLKSKKKIYKKIKKLYYSNKIDYPTYKKYNNFVNDGIPIKNLLDKYDR